MKKTLGQAINEINLKSIRDKKRKKAKGNREFIIWVGFCLEAMCFILFGFFYAVNYRFLGFISLLVALYLAFDVGERIGKNAIINHQDKIYYENKLNYKN